MEANNTAAMRGALEYLRDASREFCHLILNSKYSEVFDKYKYAEVAKIRNAIANANTALAAPLRNCDVGTPKEQAERYEVFCFKHFAQCSSERPCSGCPCDGQEDSCQFAWAQMPYEEEGAE